MALGEPTLRDLVGLLGPHPATRLQLDLAGETDRARWWILALVLGAGAGEDAALRSVRRLAAAGLAELKGLAGAERARVERLLEIRPSRAGPLAARLIRASRSLEVEYGASLELLASGAAGLEELGGRLAALTPGVGQATVLRFLRPLRDVWASAADVPLAPPARIAGVHLGWLPEDGDPELEAEALRGRRAREPDAPALLDVEAALERLGARACRRGRARLCPLAQACPLHGSDAPPGR
jgi:hypothetical protein